MGNAKIGLLYDPPLMFRHLIGHFNEDELILFIYGDETKQESLKNEIHSIYGDRYRVVVISRTLTGEARDTYRSCQMILGDNFMLTKLYSKHRSIRNMSHVSVIFSHATDSAPVRYFTRSNYLIAWSENSAKAVIPVLENSAKRPRNLRTSISLCYAGLFHIDIKACEETYRREELVERLSLDPAKPIITCFIDEASDLQELHEGLTALGDEFNVIVKSYWDWAELYPFEGLKVISDKTFNELLRFGSDFILAGAASGSLTTCAMLGLNVVPVYTSRSFKNCSVRSLFYDGEKNFDEGEIIYNYLPQPKWHHFDNVVKPVLITSPALKDCLSDTQFWEQYRAGKHEWQEKSFGRYFEHDAAEKTTDLIRSILSDEGVDEACIVQRFRCKKASGRRRAKKNRVGKPTL